MNPFAIPPKLNPVPTRLKGSTGSLAPAAGFLQGLYQINILFEGKIRRAFGILLQFSIGLYIANPQFAAQPLIGIIDQPNIIRNPTGFFIVKADFVFAESISFLVFIAYTHVGDRQGWAACRGRSRCDWRLHCYRRFGRLSRWWRSFHRRPHFIIRPVVGNCCKHDLLRQHNRAERKNKHKNE